MKQNTKSKMTSEIMDGSCAVIMAGGKGLRFQKLNHACDKPLVSILGHPFLQILSWWLAEHVQKVIILTTQAIADEAVQIKLPENCEIVVSEGRGTGADFHHLVRLKRYESYLVLNADTILDVNLEEVLASHRSSIITTCWQGVQYPEKIIVDHTSKILVSLEANPECTGNFEAEAYRYGSTGMARLNYSDLQSLNEKKLTSLEKDIYPQLIKQGKLYAHHIDNNIALDFGVAKRFVRIPEFQNDIERLYGQVVKDIKA